MPTPVKWSSRAISDVVRLTDFLKEKNPAAANAAAQAIRNGIELIAVMPEIGRRLPDDTERREYLALFGKGAYVIRYRCHPEFIAILRVFHSREDR